MRTRLDHLLVGVPDLEAGIDWLQAATGVRAAGAGPWEDEGAPGLAVVLDSPMSELTLES